MILILLDTKKGSSLAEKERIRKSKSQGVDEGMCGSPITWVGEKPSKKKTKFRRLGFRQLGFFSSKLSDYENPFQTA